MTITYRDQLSRDLTPAEVDANFRSFTDTAGGGSANVTFIQSGNGAVATDLQTRGRQVVFATDFAANGVSGAKVDSTGVTDSYLGIQAAANSFPASGGVIRLPRGTYKMSAGVTLPAGVTLQGDGMDVTLFSYTGSGICIDMSGTVSVTNTKCSLRDLSVVNTGTGTVGVKMSYTSYCKLSNVRVRGGFTNGIVGDHGNDNIFDLVFSESNTNDGWQLGQEFNASTIIGCEGVSNGRAGLFCSGARQTSVLGGAWETNTQYGIYASSNNSPAYRSKALTVRDAYIEGNGTYEVWIAAGAAASAPRSTVIDGCNFTFIAGKAATAIRVDDCDGLTIKGNNFDDAGGTYTNSLVKGSGSISKLVFDPDTNKDTSTGGISCAITLASAATVDLNAGSGSGDYIQITGTTTITALTLAQGSRRIVEFSGVLTLTNGASLILPNGQNIVTASGGVAIFQGEASGVVRCLSYIGSGTLATTFTFDGAGGTSSSVNVRYTKMGNFLLLNIPVVTATSGTGSVSLTSDSVLPSGFIPTNSQRVLCADLVNNGIALATPGLLRVTSGGNIIFYRDGIGSTAFTNSSTCGLSSEGVSALIYLG